MKYELGATDWEGVSLYRLITFKYPIISVPLKWDELNN